RELDARYPSARELTEELNRFQTGRMVEAHAYSGLERALRVLKRNKAVISVAAIALIVMAATGTIAVSRVLRSRTDARDTVRELLVEEGRVELLTGSPLRALAYLNEAARQGTSSPALGFLISTALDAMPRSQGLLDCKGDVRFLEFSPDGAQVIAACHDVAQLWTVANGNAIATLGPLPAAFDRVKYSHDGKTVVTFGDSGDARVWDAHTGLARSVLAHGAPITAASFTPDDRRIATTGQDGTAQLWDVATGVRQWKIVGKTGLLRHIYGEISGDGTLLLTVTMEGEAKGWDLETGAQRGGFRHAEHSFVLGAELSRDGTKAVTCATDRLTRVWDARTGAPLLTVGGHTDVVWKCVFSPDGTRLLTASHDGSAMVWDLETGATITSIRHGDVILWARFSPDGSRFLTVGVEGLIKVWDARSGAPLSTHDSVGGKDAHFSPDGQHLIAQRGDGRIQIWSEAPPVQTFVPPPAASVLGVSPDGARTVLARAGIVAIHDTSTGRAIAHVELRAPVALAEQELAAMTDRAVVVLDLATGATKHVIPMATPAGLELSADGARLVVTRAVGPPELWDVASGRQLAVIEGATHAKPSRTGQRVLAWRSGALPFVWDDTRGKLAIVPAREPFTALGFSAAGDRVALVETEADTTRRLRVWNAEVTTIPVIDTTDISEEPTFDPSGTYMTTIGGDRIVTVWSVATGGVHAAFATDHLVQAQVNASGTLLAGIGDSGASMVVLSADGRVLQRSPISHAPPIVSQLGFRPPAARASWTPAGDTIVTRSTSIGLWPAKTQFDLAVLGAVVARNVPWRVDRGTLAWIESVPMHVSVMR
ncbi:MAG: WD40 repeat domain-containing protein, partial [Polyangiales bacterium]